MLTAGETVPLNCEVPKPVLVQAKEVAAGIQVAVRVEEPPPTIVPGEAVRVQFGVTDTVTVALLPAPAALLPMTE